MKHNTKGLSTIVATLIIILLVLVATGIIWVVVRNVVQGGSEDVEISSKCIDSEVVVTKAIHYDTDNLLQVTVSRTGGNEVIGGVGLVITNADDTGSITNLTAFEGNLGSLEVKTVNVTITIDDPSKVTPVVYFKDSKGNNQFCSVTQSYAVTESTSA